MEKGQGMENEVGSALPCAVTSNHFRRFNTLYMYHLSFECGLLRI